MAVDQITYQQLDNVLSQLGFTRRTFNARDRTWLHYEHGELGTEFVFVEKKPNEWVYQANAISARRHLIENGLVTEDELDRMLHDTTKRRSRQAKQ